MMTFDIIIKMIDKYKIDKNWDMALFYEFNF